MPDLQKRPPVTPKQAPPPKEEKPPPRMEEKMPAPPVPGTDAAEPKKKPPE